MFEDDSGTSSSEGVAAVSGQGTTTDGQSIILVRAEKKCYVLPTFVEAGVASYALKPQRKLSFNGWTKTETVAICILLQKPTSFVQAHSICKLMVVVSLDSSALLQFFKLQPQATPNYTHIYTQIRL